MYFLCIIVSKITKFNNLLFSQIFKKIKVLCTDTYLIFPIITFCKTRMASNEPSDETGKPRSYVTAGVAR
jgi:hypothetical protein